MKAVRLSEQSESAGVSPQRWTPDNADTFLNRTCAETFSKAGIIINVSHATHNHPSDFVSQLFSLYICCKFCFISK